jgi:hypothetical protein
MPSSTIKKGRQAYNYGDKLALMLIRKKKKKKKKKVGFDV